MLPISTSNQLLEHGTIPAPVQLQGHVVDSTHRFTYLGSDMHALLRALHSRDTQTYRSGLEYIKQADQHLEAVKIEQAHEDAALQCLLSSLSSYTVQRPGL